MIMISVFLQSNDSGIFLFCSSEGNKTVGLNTTKARVCSFWLLQACQGCFWLCVESHTPSWVKRIWHSCQSLPGPRWPLGSSPCRGLGDSVAAVWDRSRWKHPSPHQGLCVWTPGLLDTDKWVFICSIPIPYFLMIATSTAEVSTADWPLRTAVLTWKRERVPSGLNM